MKVLSFLGRILGYILVFILTLLVVVYSMGLIFCYGPSTHARNLFITTLLESGQMKFVASLFMSSDKIQEIVDGNSMATFSEVMDDELIKVDDTIDKDGIKIETVSRGTFLAKIITVNDPSRVKLASIYDGSWKEYGVTLDELVTSSNAFAGINGGLYKSTGNKGGSPMGLVVKDGVIEYNNPVGIAGMHLVGFNEDNILKIIDLSGKNQSEVEQVIKEEKIRDAVAFQEESSDANNHFVKLVINGEAREVNGEGSGANPRTAIGQKEDGSVILLVTDGRGSNGHLGATASDLIDLMIEYGAVNAANIDGGSSSSMYYDGKYEMTSVTLYYSNSSWRIPTGFIVEKR